jgi:CRISPR-associated endonuclease/helicase Cas3
MPGGSDYADRRLREVSNLDESHLLAFWGKAQPLGADGPGYHPLPYHALDVAAVGKVWCELDSRLTHWFAGLLGLASDHVSGLIAPLLALHDIGKFAAGFQSKVPEHFPSAVFGRTPNQSVAGFRHDDAGYRFIMEQFPKAFAHWDVEDSVAVLPLMAAVTGHHGAPPRPQFGSRLLDDYWQAGMNAAHVYCRLIFELMGLPPVLPDERCAVHASTALAGFGIACDWLGSNQAHFPYASPNVTLAEYWPAAQLKAGRALREAGLSGVTPAPCVSLGGLLKVDHPVPTALQHWAATTDLPEGPLLILLEDETGSGKTEAALILASRLMARGDASGIYTALPTMATANALFARLEGCYSQLFDASATPSLALVHGRSHLRAAFRALTMGASEASERYGNEESASMLCAAWLADDRRKALLADIGVGTIDQAVLSILPARFQALRLFGLARKVLILDEVHAYDAFVGQELERLIEWQAAMGGSCVLLSATLPLSVRQRLAHAFLRNADYPRSELQAAGYPLATLIARGECRTQAAIGSTRARRLPVSFLRHPGEAIEVACRVAQKGQCVAYIRNTVDDAIEAYTELRDRGVDALLFHARMALIDRFDVECRILELFGKGSDDAARGGKVLVATQVIEQSLDLDFDAMITDLAPIDLIIQRAGRLWRHARPDRSGLPELLVVAPEPTADADKNWFGRLLPRAQWVYSDHARLWLTADVLQQRGAIETPTEVRFLIESVYGEAAEDRIPEALLTSRLEAEGTSSAHRGQANRQVLDPYSGYTSIGPWDDEARATTRLQDRPQTTLRLVVVRGNRLIPYADLVAEADRLSPAERWTLSEVQVAATRAHSEEIPTELAAAAAAAREAWGRFDQSKLLLVLSGDDDALAGTIRSKDGQALAIMYSRSTGLVFQ